MPGYRVDYASTSRAGCKGPKPCAGSRLEKGTFRLGSLVEFQGKSSFAWRHWGCTSPKIISNLKAQHRDPSELDGFGYLRPEDQAKIVKAWEDGHVDPEDIPPTARKDDTDNAAEDKLKKRACALSPAKADAEGEDGVPAAEKPKRSRANKTEAEGHEEDNSADEPLKKRARAEKTAPAAEATSGAKDEGSKPAAKAKDPAKKTAGPKEKAMAPIALPPQVNGVTRPRKPPSEPPTSVDLAEAHLYRVRVQEAHINKPSPAVAEGFKQAVDYENKVYAKMGGGVDDAPGWVADLKHFFSNELAQQTQFIKDEITQTKTELSCKLDELQGDLSAVRQDNDTIRDTVQRYPIQVQQSRLRTYNRQLHDGSGEPFEVVVFNDGTHPVNNHGLPALHMSRQIKALEGEDLQRYLAGYGIYNVGTVEEQRKRVMAAVGARY